MGGEPDKAIRLDFFYGIVVTIIMIMISSNSMYY